MLVLRILNFQVLGWIFYKDKFFLKYLNFKQIQIIIKINYIILGQKKKFNFKTMIFNI